MVVKISKLEYQPLETTFKNVNQALKAAVDQHPDNIAIEYTYRNMKLTYKDLYTNVLKFANALKAKGIKKGDAVGIVLANCPEFAISFYACLQIGAVGCSMIKMLKPAELADISERAELKALILGDDGKRVIYIF